MSLPQSIRTILTRDLRTLAKELDAYGDEKLIWALPPGLKNSGGTLALHLIGNTRHFIGTVLGKSDYVRNREHEFSGQPVPLTTLKKEIETAISDIERTLQQCAEIDLDSIYPIEVGGHRLTVGLFLTHLAVHFGYHLGQLDYHRRIVTGNSDGLGAMAISEIAH